MIQEQPGPSYDTGLPALGEHQQHAKHDGLCMLAAHAVPGVIGQPDMPHQLLLLCFRAI